MTSIHSEDKKYLIIFKRKDLRPNQIDDKFEIFRNTIGLDDVRDLLDLSRYTQNRMTDEIHKTDVTVTDINSFENPIIIAKLNLQQVSKLRKNPNIEFVEEEIVRRTAEEFVGWQIPKLRVNAAWIAPLSVKGSGVNVAIIDTGCDPHFDFGQNVKINQNFTSETGTAARDVNHHGTHVAGICGAIIGNNDGIQGVAPECNLWNLRAGNAQGLFSTADMIEAHQYATQNNAHVVNLSIAGGPFSQAEQNAITTGFTAGIVYCGAAGNTGREETIMYPGGYDGVIGISNMQSSGFLSETSTWGTFVDFVAPGKDITSLGENNGYRMLDGTSMACPAVSGICALMLSAYRDNGCPPYTPGAKKNQIIEKVLRDTASPAVGQYTDQGEYTTRYGYGLPQADKAVAAMKGVIPPVTPPAGGGTEPGPRPNPPQGGSAPYVRNFEGEGGGSSWWSDIGPCRYVYNRVVLKWRLGEGPSSCVGELSAT